MKRRLRSKFILVAMLSVTIVLLGLIGAIDLASFHALDSAADEKLSVLMKNGGRFPDPGKKDKAPLPAPDRFQERRDLEMPFDTRYFSVWISSDGKSAEADTTNIAAVSPEEAVSYAKSLYSSKKTFGYQATYKYLAGEKADSSGRILYVFVDCSRDLANFHAFLKASIGYSLLGLALVFILVLLFSRAAVRPIVESYEKQKRFITDASHELKTPLTIIRADTEVLELTGGENDWTKSMKKQVDRLSRLVNEMVFLTRMDEGRSLIHMEDLDLSGTVKEAAEAFLPLCQEKKKQLLLSIDPAIRIRGDGALLSRLVCLLLDNAVKYSNEGGTIRLFLSGRTGKRVFLTVENTLPPSSISPGDHKEFFDRFYRADRSRRSDGASFGIGLSTAQAIVTAHKGRISCSSPDGSSILFTVSL